MDTLLLQANGIGGLLTGAYVMWHAFKRSNGKRPIRIVSAGILLYFGIIYTLAFLMVIPIASIGPVYTRPIIWLLYLIPVWECWAEDGTQGAH